MHRAARTVALAGLVAGIAVVAAPTPAGATTTATSSGTVVTVTATGTEQIGFSCNSTGKFVADGVAATPAVACAVVTKVNVNGDGANQNVLADDLDDAAFAANPLINASLGGGADRLTETDRADTIDMGADDDIVFLKAGGLANVIVTLGSGGSDTAYFDATPDDDTIAASSTSATVSVSVTNDNGGSTRTAVSPDRVILRGNEGDDTISGTGVTAASDIASVGMIGGPGDDTLNAGVAAGDLFGTEGTNTFNGGPSSDTFHSYSETDVINSGSGGTDTLVDEFNGRSGTRTITGSALEGYTQSQTKCDAQTRVRPGPGDGTVITSSLCRPGIQALPGSTNEISVLFDDAVKNKGLADVIIPNSNLVEVHGDSFHDDLIDITIPSGTWSVSGVAPNAVTVNPTDPQWGNVVFEGITNASIHPPWTNKNQGFAYRLIRDLLYRFPGIQEQTTLSAPITAGTKTRAQTVTGVMNTDEYRGNEVDRVFVRFLDRAPDPSGRTYWINALRNGRSLQIFRAQLFGSNEYFANSSSSNANFVRNAYFDVLGRLPDPSGEAYWTNKINNGTGRGSVANAFLASTEARRAIVKDQFQRFALRLPTTAESEQWVTNLASPTGENSLIASLAASSAYYNAG